jgi:hypothetical protein
MHIVFCKCQINDDDYDWRLALMNGDEMVVQGRWGPREDVLDTFLDTSAEMVTDYISEQLKRAFIS